MKKYAVILALLTLSCKEGVIKEIPFIFEDHRAFEIDNRTLLT